MLQSLLFYNIQLTRIVQIRFSLRQGIGKGLEVGDKLLGRSTTLIGLCGVFLNLRYKT